MAAEVKKVAEIARLKLTPVQIKSMDKDIKDIIKAFEVLEKAPTVGVKPSFQPIEIKNATRKDQVEPSLPRKKALANTKNKKDGYFTGPRAI